MLSNYIAIICLTFTIGSCDKDVAPAVQRLVGIEDRNGLLLMSFDYDACDMVGIQYFEPLIVNTAPVQYPDPINENSASRERIICGYEGGLLRELSIDDRLRNGTTRRRTYTAAYAQERLSQLILTDESPARVGAPLNRDLSYFYDDRGRVDLITYGRYYSASFTYDDADNITYAEYRDPDLEKSTKEFYGYAGAQGANPFVATPLKLVQPYASYWSAQPVVQATFGLRRYRHVAEGGRVVKSADLTIYDSLAVQRYLYSESSCR